LDDLEQFEIQAETKFDNARRYYLRLHESNFEDRALPDVLINCYRKKGHIECQTLDIMKLNKRLEDSHQEVVLMSDKTIQNLTDSIVAQLPSLYRVCESIAMLDMIASFAQLATTSDYCKPEITDCVGIRAGRHPIREKVRFSSSSSRFYEAYHTRPTKKSLSLMTSMQVNKSGFRSLLDAT
jgi:DNA mismatch repair protein MSH4